MQVGIKKTKISRLRRKERATSLLFILPMYLQFVIFTLIFMVYSLVMSFTNWNIIAGTKEAVGFENFIRLFQDNVFYTSIWNTLFLMLGIPVGMLFALLAAMALNRKMVGRNLFRTLLYLPSISSAVAIALLWRWIYNAEYGILNMLLYDLFRIEGPAWLNDPNWIKPSLMIMGIWRGAGSTMILYLAGLQNIPTDYYEAIEIDGGNSLHKFRYITLPLITPVSFFIAITSVIGGLQAFGDQYIMTGAGPKNSAMTIVYYIWKQGFELKNMGYASAISWALAICIMLVTLLQFKLSNKWVYDTSN